MMRTGVAWLVAVYVVTVGAAGYGQQSRTNSTARTSVTGLGTAGTSGSRLTSRSQGLQQSGQLSSTAAISRDANAFVGDSGGNFLARGNSTNSRGLTGAGSSSLYGLGGMMSGNMGSYGMSSYGRGNMMGNRGGYGGQFGMQMGSNRYGANTQIRNQLRVGFAPPTLVASEVSGRLLRRVPRIPGLERVAGIDVKMDGRTAVLQGVVASQSQRDVLERLALLEPGISQVQNELVVDPSLASPGTLPAPEAVPADTP
jgi:osmotically-inducible protein OsmY